MTLRSPLLSLAPRTSYLDHLFSKLQALTLADKLQSKRRQKWREGVQDMLASYKRIRREVGG